MLRLDDVHAGYGKLKVLRGITLEVRGGEIVGLLGSNGAGKTTTMRAVAGLLAPTGGSIELNGQKIHEQRAHRIFRAGLALVPQERELFPDMTVEQNLELGGRLLSARDRAKAEEEIFQLFPRLRERRIQLAGTLSGGERAMLAVGRALVSRPKVLLLDEPTAGLAPKVVDELGAALKLLNGAGQSILLVEQNLRLALAVCDRVYVMSRGTIVTQGAAEQFRNGTDMLAAYFG